MSRSPVAFTTRFCVDWLRWPVGIALVSCFVRSKARSHLVSAICVSKPRPASGMVPTVGMAGFGRVVSPFRCEARGLLSP